MNVLMSWWWPYHYETLHYSDVIMTTIASQITSFTVVYSIVYSDADQRKHQSSSSLAFVWGIHRDRWIPRTKGQLRGKCFHLMTSSCFCIAGRLSIPLNAELSCFFVVSLDKVLSKRSPPCRWFDTPWGSWENHDWRHLLSTCQCLYYSLLFVT